MKWEQRRPSTRSRVSSRPIMLWTVWRRRGIGQVAGHISVQVLQWIVQGDVGHHVGPPDTGANSIRDTTRPMSKKSAMLRLICVDAIHGSATMAKYDL
jgi:hypothetical protein